MYQAKLKNGISINIRRLQKVDFKKGFIETYRSLNPTPLTPKIAVKYFNKIKKCNPNIFVYIVALSENNQIIGSATLIIDQKFGGKIGRLEDIVTRKEYEGLGVSTILQKFLISKTNELKCYKLILNCKENFLNFYKKIGFEKDQIAMKIFFDDNTYKNLNKLIKKKIK